MNNIYNLWWQGFENAPPIIRICHESLKRNIDPGRHKLCVLDEKNIFQYVEIPGYIMDKHKAGKITMTHLSDIIRSMLLRDNGGLWTDASILFTKPLVEQDIFERDFFTLKNPMARPKDITSCWECFLISGKKDFPLFAFLVDFWLEYWKKEDELITYLLTDHIFYIAYQENSRVRKAIDLCPSFYYRIDYFQRMLNAPYLEKEYGKILENETYLKMSYKFPLYEMAKGGAKTYYGHLLEEYLK